MNLSWRRSRRLLLVSASGALALAASAVAVPVAASVDDPGTIPLGGVATNNDPLTVMTTESGRIFLSTDGSGTNDPAGADIRAEKPSAGATVRSAFLFAASTGFRGHTMVDTDVSLAGTFVHWSSVVPSDIGSSNGWGNVTSIVKPTLDAAPVGITSFHVIETNTFDIDGEGLAVIWNDPAQTKDNTVALLFGAQNTAGDNFKVLYAQPIDKTDPSLVLQMSLGISFGYQQPFPFCTGQFSTIDVNGTRMSSSAGGQDDGQGANGALITVGGIGDDNLLPVDPNSSCDPTGFRQDNELYNFNRFVTNGDTQTTIHTHNPSSDDNIFFAGFFLKSVSAVVGAGIVLSPQTATNDAIVGSTHTVTGTVQDNNGNHVVGAQVTFTITAGPNAGASGVCSVNVTCTTDSSGKVSFTYSSNGNAGTDTIQACFTDATNTQRCATASKIWVSVADQQITAQGTTVNATEGHAFSGPVATFTDPSATSTASEYSATVDWGDGTTSTGIVGGPMGGPFTVSGTHTYADEGTYTVHVTITDLDTATNTARTTSTANVADADLTAGALTLTGGTEGSGATTASFTFTDDNPASTTADFTAAISWGDGSTSAGAISGATGGPYTVTGSHTYAEEGSYTVSVAVTDDGGSTTSATGTANVADGALTAVCAAPAVFTPNFNGATATFTDAASPGGTLSDFTATINWGDGSPNSAGTVSGPNGGPYTVSGAHNYTSTGPFTITTTITDVGGKTATTSCSTIVFAFAPGGGAFVIGDTNSANGTAVTFWGAQWAKQNSPSGGAAPSSFKGFAENPTTPTCGTGWSTDPGNSTPPPDGPLPAYMAVIVTSSSDKSGSQISGDTVHIVIVKTDPGYASDPGHAGTGTVVAQVC